MNVTEFLIYLASSGGNIVIVSWCLEQWRWYQSQTPTTKRNLFFCLSALVAVLAYVVLTFVDASILEAIAPVFQILYATFTAIYLGSKFHSETKQQKVYDI